VPLIGRVVQEFLPLPHVLARLSIDRSALVGSASRIPYWGVGRRFYTVRDCL